MRLWVLSLVVLCVGCAGPRIEKLEEENAALRREVDALRQQLAPPPEEDSEREGGEEEALEEEERHYRESKHVYSRLGIAEPAWRLPCSGQLVLDEDIRDLPTGVGKPSFDPNCVVTRTQMAIIAARSGLKSYIVVSRTAQLPHLLRLYVAHEGRDPKWAPKAEEAIKASFEVWRTSKDDRRGIKPEDKADARLEVMCAKVFCAAFLTGPYAGEFVSSSRMHRAQGLSEFVTSPWSDYARHNGIFAVFARRHFKRPNLTEMYDELIEAGVLEAP